MPRVLGVGYDTIGDILNANLALKLLIVVMLAKAIALVVSLGSGTSGGLLAPMFMSSAAMGGVFALLVDRIVPGAHLSAGAFALVAMGAVFGAASRAAFTFIIFAFEITRDYNSVLPLMLVTVIADGIAMLLMPSASIMTEKLARRGLRIHQDYEADLLQQMSVSQTMDTEVPSVPGDVWLSDLADRIARREPEVSRHQALVITDSESKLAGIITRADIFGALEKDSTQLMTVLEAGICKVVTYPDESLHEAGRKCCATMSAVCRSLTEIIPITWWDIWEGKALWPRDCAVWMEEHVREPGWIKSSWR